MGVRRHRRARASDHSGGRAQHAHAVQHRAGRRAEGARDLSAQPQRQRGGGRDRARKHRQRRTGFLGLVRHLPRGERPRRRDRAGLLARRAVTGSARAGDSGSERVDGQRLPGDHAGHARRPARARHAQERRRAVDSDHGYQRAAARIPQVQPAGGHQGAGLADAGVRAGQTDRRRSQRCAGVLEHAAAARWRTRTRRRRRTRRRSRACGRAWPVLRLVAGFPALGAQDRRNGAQQDFRAPVGRTYAHISSPSGRCRRAGRRRADLRSSRRARRTVRRHGAGSARRLQEPVALADVLRRLQRPASQPAHADHAGERPSARGAVDVPDRRHPAPGIRGDAAGRGRRRLRDRADQQRLGDRRADRPAVLALPARAAGRSDLRRDLAGQPRLRHARHSAVHGDARRAPRGARCQNRKRALGLVMADYKIGYAATVAPLVVKDKVIVGIAGGEFPTRGFIDAYDPETGKRVWRFYTIPGPGEPGSETWPGSEVMARGGGATWVTGTLRSGAEHGLLGHRQPEPAVLRRRSRGRQPLHRVDRGARRRHRQAEVALPVHAARHARLGLEPGAGARRPDDRRPAAQGRDGRQPQRVLLRARSRHREAARRQAVHRHDLGAGDRAGRPSDRPQRRQQGLHPRPVGGHELHAAVVRSGAAAVLRHRPRDVRRLLPGEGGDRPRPHLEQRHRPARRRAQLRRAARDRSGDRWIGNGSSSIRRRRWPA